MFQCTALAADWQAAIVPIHPFGCRLRRVSPPKEDFNRMSHIVTVQTKVRDPAAVAAAAARMNLPAPAAGKVGPRFILHA
jgi:hypothetical protein